MPIEEAGVGRLATGVDPSIVNRLIFIAVFVALIFAIFGVRLFQLQVIEGEDLGNRARRNSVRTVRLEAPRGDIVDRFGRELATTRPAFGVHVMPAELRERALTLAALGNLLDRDPGELSERVGTPKGRMRFQPVRVAKDLPYDSRTRVESHLYALPGVFTDVSPRRYYVGGSLAAHILGYTGEIQTRQLEKRSFADYRSGDVIGQAGVESRYESILRGRAGGRNVVVDVAGRVDEVLDEVEATPGGTLMLTIDRDLQRVAEDAFLPDVIGGDEETRRGRGARPAQRRCPRSGVAPRLRSKQLCGWHRFSDLEATHGERRPADSKPSRWPDSIHRAPPTRPSWRQPASKRGRSLPTIGCSVPAPSNSDGGPIAVGNAVDTVRWIFTKRWCARVTCSSTSSASSSESIGLAFFANGFHLGRRTGIALGNESPGIIPTRAWKERRFSEVWLKGETVSAAIGQGYNLTTPMQLAVAYAAIANGGTIFRPRILLRRAGPDDTVEQGPEPEALGKVPVSPEHLATITRALEGVVHGEGGTGGRARVPDVRVAGKTGTSQVVRLKQTEELEEDEIPFKFPGSRLVRGFCARRKRRKSWSSPSPNTAGTVAVRRARS